MHTWLVANFCLHHNNSSSPLQDIAHENILMNHHGKIPGDLFMDVWPPPEFRSTFPVRYYLMDFGCSVHFTPSSRLDDGFIKPFPINREQCAPEMRGLTKYDPFSADIYVAARVIYGFFAVRLLFLMRKTFYLNQLSTARISFRSFLAFWSFCKTCHPLILQVEYLLLWH